MKTEPFFHLFSSASAEIAFEIGAIMLVVLSLFAFYIVLAKLEADVARKLEEEDSKKDLSPQPERRCSNSQVR